MHDGRRISYSKAIAVCLAFALNVGYILFSYNQTAQFVQNKQEALLLQTKKETNEAVQGFSQYLTLTEARLSHTSQTPEMISPILSEKIEMIMNKPFPEILGMTFFPSLHSNVGYTRFGKTIQKTTQRAEGVFYLGKGVFEYIKKLYDKHQHSTGTLASIFSLNKILYRNFPEKEISVVPEKNIDLAKNPSSFKMDDFPYVIAVGVPSFTLWQFLLDSKLQILSISLLTFVILFLGMATGVLVTQKIFARQRTVIHQLHAKLKVLDKKNTNTNLQLISSQNLLKQRELSQKAKHFLTTCIAERYRYMAGQAQAITMTTSELILEEAKNDILYQKLHSISQEGTTVLRQLVNGFPMKFVEEDIDVLKCLETVEEIFLPEMIEKNISFQIKGKILTPPRTDKVIFEIILHNVFHIIMERLTKNGVVIVEFKRSTPLQIHFQDSGYDIDHKIKLIKTSPPPEDILCLEKFRLEEFTSYLGYVLSFENTGALANSIKLTFPLIIDEAKHPDNVINLFGHKSYES